MQCRVPGFPAQRRPLAPGAAATEAPPALAPMQQLNGGAVPLVRFGFPKGSLQKSTEELFARAGYQVSFATAGTAAAVACPRCVAAGSIGLGGTPPTLAHVHCHTLCASRSASLSVATSPR